MKFSVVIISINEGSKIQDCISSIKLTGKKDVQIILSDGGSNDGTIEIALNNNIKVVTSLPGRGIQFNTGAESVNGEVILFLHADTSLPADAFELLENYFRDEKVKIGTFRLSFDKNNFLLSLYSKFATIDSIFTKFGDQCIVMRRSFFKELNGFKSWPIFEDVDLLRRARKLTRIYSFPSNVITSCRKFDDAGIIKQQFLNAGYILQYLLGKPPAELFRSYYNLNKTGKNILETERSSDQ